ncbi:cupin domain-containing protein [Cohnella silvisoli]|uniref:cupin domain-containing protein n=1 Tax=Cohnella silvisoli TaxID=2873699 RepID=UPI0035A1CFA3|nr:cupin domain-containing protein [Cohnella silvisoli]
MGRVTGAPGKVSGTHHHGETETGVYILSGHTRIYYGERFKEYVQLGPGDLIYVPAFLPHIKYNFDYTEPVEFLLLEVQGILSLV